MFISLDSRVNFDFQVMRSSLELSGVLIQALRLVNVVNLEVIEVPYLVLVKRKICFD